jgi:stage V sporulation protein AD
MAHRVGNGTIILDNPVFIKAFASVVSKKESEGPLKDYFDKINLDMMFGEESWEKAESVLQKTAANICIEKSGLRENDIDCMFAGDLLNQCIGSTYGLRDLSIPFLGLYGACSTMAEGLSLASLFCESGAAKNALALTSSHFCSSERQFRFPLDYGSQRPPTSQWTVTGSGAVILTTDEKTALPLKIDSVCFGKIIDLGITDINNMGAAMAPAAADTLFSYLSDTSTSPDDYDLIITGDLGAIGSDLFSSLMEEKGVSLKDKHRDCGLLIFDRKAQDTHSGGSGCGCSASVLCSYILKSMETGELNNILFMATGALMSTVSNQQSETIPSIAHLLRIRRKDKQ